MSLILYEDQHYLIVNKPGGMPIHATLDKTRKNLYDELKKSHAGELFLIHRLDSETSGVVIFSKTKEANQFLDQAFKQRTIEKNYLALVEVPLKELHGVMDDFLKKEKIGRLEKMIKVTKGGEKAITEFSLLEKKDHFFIYKLSIKTGRMHQIRAQLALRGSPIYADAFYGSKVPHERLKLHSHEVRFQDPFSKKEIHITADIPSDFFPRTNHLLYYKFYKPFDVLSQFTPEDGARSLAEFSLPKEIYAAGRLDKDSEGLLLLTNDGPLIERMLNPKTHFQKTYWVQVEGVPTEEALAKLRKGVMIQDYKTLPAEVRKLEREPDLPPRDPPIRERKSIPTTWIEIKIVEGKNRQVRRMTAAVGFPTLRLVRVAIGEITLEGLKPGMFLAIPKP